MMRIVPLQDEEIQMNGHDDDNDDEADHGDDYGGGGDDDVGDDDLIALVLRLIRVGW